MAALILASLVTRAGAATLDYLHVEANEGMAAGGHAAVRLGDEVFHFQHDGDGLLRLERESAGAFERRVRRLENRTIHVATVPVDDDTFALLREAFAARLRREEGEAAEVAALADDRRLVEAIAASRRGDAERACVVVAGAGYFSDAAGPSEPSGAAVRAGPGEAWPGAAAVRARLGGPWLVRRIAAERDALRATEPLLPDPPLGIARRTAERLARLRALELLERGGQLRPDSTRSGDDDVFRLGGGEPAALVALRASLEARVAALAASDAPGAGRAMLVGLARLAAIDASLQAGRWIVLDVFPDEARVVPQRRVARVREAVERLAARTAAAFVANRRALVARNGEGGFPEAVWAEVETSGAVLAELRAALAGGDLRLPAGTLVPARSAPMPVVAPSGWTDATLDALHAEALRRQESRADGLRARRGYDLLRRNCVTELFRTVDVAVARAAGIDPDDAAARPRLEAELQRRLGGHVDVAGGPGIVPLVSMALVERQLRVSAQETLPSRRLTDLAAVVDWREQLRELSPLTARLYSTNPEDSTFAFFTDDSPWLRPLFGVANLATGLGAAVAGLVTLPVDHGDRSWAGLRGAFFSLPELAFMSLRRGTYVDDPAEPGASGRARVARVGGRGTGTCAPVAGRSRRARALRHPGDAW